MEILAEKFSVRAGLVSDSARSLRLCFPPASARHRVRRKGPPRPPERDVDGDGGSRNGARTLEEGGSFPRNSLASENDRVPHGFLRTVLTALTRRWNSNKSALALSTKDRPRSLEINLMYDQEKKCVQNPEF